MMLSGGHQELVNRVRFHLQCLYENELFCNTDEWPEGAPPSVQELIELVGDIK